jgi:hypothetical protein
MPCPKSGAFLFPKNLILVISILINLNSEQFLKIFVKQNPGIDDILSWTQSINDD